MSSIDSLSWMSSFENAIDAEATFSITSSNPEHRLELLPDGQEIPVSAENWEEFQKLAVRERMAEFDVQIGAIRQGLGLVIPLNEYSLLTCRDMESKICGNPDLTVEQLRVICNVSLSGEDENMFWKCMEQFDATERSNFLRFSSGYRRAPTDTSTWRGLVSVNQGGNRDGLPTAGTCSNYFTTPRYSSLERMMEQYRTAFACAEIDAD